MPEENVVTEEIGVGTISGGGGSSGFDIGQFLLTGSTPAQAPSDILTAETNVVSGSSPAMLFDDIQAKSTLVTPSLSSIATEVKKMDVDSSVVSPGPGNGPSSIDLNAVSAILNDVEGSCADADEIASRLGIPKETVVYCIEWLVSQGLVAKDATKYCGLSAVKKMCSQLKGCKECFENRV